MKRLILVLCFISGIASANPPVVGQGVIFQYDSTHIYPAVITRVLHDNVVNLVALSAIYSVWYTGGVDGAVVPSMTFATVDKATATDYRWDDNPNVPVEGPAGPTGATGPGSNISGISTPTLTLNGSSVLFDSTHDTQYYLVVSVTGTISLSGGFDGIVTVLCDVNSTPTTPVGAAGAIASGTAVIGLALITGGYYSTSVRVAAGHRCRLTTTNNVGTPTYTIVNQKLQTLAP